MTATYNVAILLGSLRRSSYCRLIAGTLAEVAPPGLSLTIVEIGDLPNFNEDLETDHPPAPWVAFRQAIAAADAVVFITPEYNRSIPGALKNAIDVGSSPYGRSVWDNKPGGIISCSNGAMGGFGANHHLRQALVFTNIPVMSQPEAYIGGIDTLFGADGKMSNAETRVFVSNYMKAFEGWIHRLTR